MTTLERSERLKRLTPEQRLKLLAALRQDAVGRVGGGIPRRSSTGPAPASFAQRRLWLFDRLTPDSPAYNVPFACRLSGRLDAAALRRALDGVAGRHETLRTVLADAPDGPVQVVSPELRLSLPEVDLQGIPAALREEEAARIVRAEARRPFDLARGPLLRALLLRLDGREHTLFCNLHHAVTDAWSNALLVNEIGSLYAAGIRGERAVLPELPIQYADFAEWQRGELQGEALQRLLEYWKRRLEGAPQLLDLPSDHPRPSRRTYRGATASLELGGGTVRALEELGRQRGATLFATLLAAFQTLLGRYTGSEDVVVGSPVANRDRTELENLLGFFVNMLVLRSDLSGDPSFSELVDRVCRIAVEAQEHAALPFEVLVEELRPERETAANPLFQVAFVLRSEPPATLELPGLAISRTEVREAVAKFDLTLFAEPAAGAWRLWLEYSRELFEAPTTLRLLLHFRTLLEETAARPEARLSELTLLSESERHQVLREWDAPAGMPSSDATVHGLVAAWAATAPDAVAVMSDEGLLTYAGLADRAARLGRFLRGLGVRPGEPVGVALERSADQIVALLGALQAGGAYVPLDLSYPVERLAAMVEDAGVRCVITRSAVPQDLPVRPVDLADERIAAESGAPPASSTTPDDIAYVLYTSGSTGRPKGVAVPHRAVVRLVRGASFARLSPDETLLQLAPVSFDASTLEIWGALANGGRLAVMPPGPPTPEGLNEAVRRFGVTTLWLTAGLFHQVVDARPSALRGIRQLLAGGDVLSPAHCRKVLEEIPGLALIDGYGPTENTTFTCCQTMRRPEEVASPVPIGRPIAGTRVCVLDASLRPAPVGVPGELCAGGDGLAHGYARQPALTAERFVPHPWSATPGGRLYRTGDRVRWRADGTIEFLGRADQQVKVRGFRIEIEEVEAVLGSHPHVRQAAVAALPDPHGDKRLAAWVVMEGEEDPQELQRWTRERLPTYMVPSLWCALPELPLTPNGKVDRRALPAPVPLETTLARRAPRTPTEEVLAGIWADLLGVGAVGVEDDFFELGGHSLLATRIAARAYEIFGVPVPLASFFDHPTVAGLAVCIDALRLGAAGQASEPIRPAAREDGTPLSFAQERLWILDRFEPGSPNFNITGSVRLRGELDAAVLRRALHRVVARHGSLRTTFEAVGDHAVQRIAPDLELPLPVIDLRGLAPAARERALAVHSRDVAATSFDLARGPLLRLVLLETDDREHVLLLATHHIVSDGWSMGVLVRELTATYAAVAAGEEPQLPELPVQYADYAVWQRGRLQGERLEEQVRHWREQLAGAPPALELPTDRPRPAIRTFRGARRPLVLGEPLASRLRALARRQGASLFMLLLAVFDVLLQRLSGQNDVVVGTPVAGRGKPEVEGLIGMFLNTLVLRADLSGDPEFTTLLARVRKTALDAYAHQEVPFEKLLDELRPERDLSRTPLFQVFFNMLNFPAASIELPGLTVEILDPPRVPAKFDLTVYAAEERDKIHFDFVYNADLFTDQRMAELLRQYAALLDQVVAEPAARIGHLTLATEAATLVLPDPRLALDGGWVGAVHEIFASLARREPGRLAVSDRDEAWTYGELNERADRLARRLRRAGVGRGDVVAIYGHRSARLVWAVLGVMKAGAAFSVLDPAHPPARLVDCLRLGDPRGWIEIAAAGAVPQALAEHVARLPCRLTVPLPAGGDPFAADEPVEDSGLPVGPDDLAYIAFTSGSTGVPKGILGRHGPLSHFIPWQRREFDLRDSDRYSMLSGLAHDPLQRDMFTPLQTGGAICVPEPADIATPGRLAEWMRRERVTVAHLTPAMGQILTEIPPGSAPVRLNDLRRAFFVGDILTRRDVARLRELAPEVLCVNFYGSTETQRAVGYHRSDGDGEHRPAGLVKENLPLGRGMRDVQLLVLTPGGALAGIGELGEIHVRSPHLAQGYLGDPAGTAARFLPDPWGGTPGGRLYRTGDLGRYQPDGEVDFAGRADFQVKIRGFRIEPGEVEALLARHPAVREALVVARNGARGEKRLVAYVVAQGDVPATAELRTWLKERLPEPMVPSAFVPLPRMPLNPNGKVDRRALPEPREEHREPDAAYVAPRNESERTIAAVLLDVLQLEKIGVHDNFFELGGNSLLLVRAHARLRELLGGDLQVVDLFSHPTVGSLAEYLSRSRSEPAAARQSDERMDKIEAGQNRLRARLRQRQQQTV